MNVLHAKELARRLARDAGDDLRAPPGRRGLEHLARACLSRSGGSCSSSSTPTRRARGHAALLRHRARARRPSPAGTTTSAARRPAVRWPTTRRSPAELWTRTEASVAGLAQSVMRTPLCDRLGIEVTDRPGADGRRLDHAGTRRGGVGGGRAGHAGGRADLGGRAATPDRGDPPPHAAARSASTSSTPVPPAPGPDDPTIPAVLNEHPRAARPAAGSGAAGLPTTPAWRRRSRSRWRRGVPVLSFAMGSPRPYVERAHAGGAW